jgi:oligopeptidase A
MTDANPLLDFSGLPRFADITPAHVAPAVDALLAECEATLEAVATDPSAPTWDNTSVRLALSTEKLSRAFGVVRHLHAVVDTPELRAAYTAALPKVTAFWTRLGSDERLYARFKAIKASDGYARLTAEQRRSVDHAVRDGVLSGAELQGAAKARFAAIEEELAKLGQQYSEHVMDATDAFAYYATPAELDGVPADVLQATAEAAQADGRPGLHKLSLHMPVYLPVMQYARDRALRERLYRAYSTRASDLHDGSAAALDNSALMQRLLRLRGEKARLLGMANYAELSLVPKMAESPAQVLAFLRDMAARAKPYAERDMRELRAFAAEQLGLPELELWDIPYASEKLREARYAFSEQEVKQYFTEPRVIDGLFRLVERLFGVRIEPDEAPVWHADVRFYRVVDAGSGALVGQFYFDLYARPGKQPGAWMDDARPRWLRPDGRLQTPVTYLTCNFAAPVGGKPALLSHGDVETLFHEFGHGLHLLLSRVDEPTVGMGAVEWDAIELPSQFMENFCWEWDVVEPMTAHVEHGASLPRALFDKMLAAKNFQAGMQTVRQLEFGLADMRLHTEFATAAHAEGDAPFAILQLVDEVRAEVAVVPYPPFNRMIHSFGHIFGGGYAAGYYSYKWAEVLSADAFAQFEEAGVLDGATGARFRDEILAVGAARPALDSFVAFRGRKPKPDALLRHQGMDGAAAANDPAPQPRAA